MDSPGGGGGPIQYTEGGMSSTIIIVGIIVGKVSFRPPIQFTEGGMRSN